MPFPLLAILAVAIFTEVVSVFLAPKPKVAKPAAAQDGQGPTADAGQPVKVIFGEVWVKEANCCFSGENSVHEYQVSA